jgi:hypothetical protein
MEKIKSLLNKVKDKVKNNKIKSITGGVVLLLLIIGIPTGLSLYFGSNSSENAKVAEQDADDTKEETKEDTEEELLASLRVKQRVRQSLLRTKRQPRDIPVFLGETATDNGNTGIPAPPAATTAPR